jgi:hypothetical protein
MKASIRLRGRRAWRTGLALLALTFISHLLVVANPGFFSHDEWQRADFVQANPLSEYARQYGALKAGPDFSFPVRPIGFLQQGVSTLWMSEAPVVAHALDVALHAAVVVLLWRLLLMLGMPGRLAAMSAMLFAISPLASVAVGWVGASFDRWYVLFAVVCAQGAALAARWGLGSRAAFLILFGSIGAILSKETAVVLPGALLLMYFALFTVDRERVRWRPALASIVLSSLPIIAYLIIRWPAIEATLAGHGGAYAPSMANVPGNALIYIAQPFALQAVELVSIHQLAPWQWWLALTLHGALVVLLWQRWGARMAAAYLAAYFVFLMPVLAPPMQGAHYLYASAIPFSIAVAALLRTGPLGDVSIAQRRVRLSFTVIVFAFLLARSLYIQGEMYSVGKCQSEFLSSLDPQADAAIEAGAASVRVVGAPGVREYVAVRSLFGREPYSEGGKWPTTVGAATEPTAGERVFVMQENCRIRAAPGVAGTAATE